jgi:hypothetical protein
MYGHELQMKKRRRRDKKTVLNELLSLVGVFAIICQQHHALSGFENFWKLRKQKKEKSDEKKAHKALDVYCCRASHKEARALTTLPTCSL